MTEVKTYRATDRGQYQRADGGYELAEEGDVFTTLSPQGSWMEEVEAVAPVSADYKPDYNSMKLPELTRFAVERELEVPADLKGMALKKHLVAVLELNDE